MAEVIKRGDAWRDTESERGFSMALGRLGDPADSDCLLVEAVQNQDNVVAMLSLVPWGNNGVSLDLMRRSPQSPNGTIELMVTELSQRSEGIESPVFAEFRDVPLGVRTGRAAQCRSDCPVVARPAGVLLALVAARTLYRSNGSTARVGAALRVLRRRSARPTGRRRVGYRGGLPGAAVLTAKQAAAHRTSHCGARESGRDGSAAPRRQRA